MSFHCRFVAVAIAGLCQVAAAPAEAVTPNELLQQLGALETRWAKQPKSTRIRRQVLRLAPEAKRLFRRRLEAGKVTSDMAQAAQFIHTVYDKSGRQDGTGAWRDLWLLLSAKAGGIVGDFAGTQWFFLLLADAKLRSPDVFARALSYLDSTGESHCDGRKIPQSICELQIGGDVLRAGTMVQAGLELQAAALTRLENLPTAVPSELFRLRMRLVLGWWRDGAATYAERLLPALEQTYNQVLRDVPPRELAAYHALRAEMFEANLDFAAAAREFTRALKFLRKSEPTGNSLDLAYVAVDLLNNIATRHLSQYTCAACPQDLAQVFHDFAVELATNPKLLPTHSAQGYMLMRAAPKGMFSTRERRTLAKAAIARSIENSSQVGRSLIERYPEPDRALFAALVQLTDAQIEDSQVRAIAGLISARDKAQADRARKVAYDPSIDQAWQFGDFNGIVRDMAQLAFLLRFNELHAAEHSVLDQLWTFYRRNFPSQDGDLQTATRANLATALAPAFARLAELEAQGRTSRIGARVLQEADRMITAKLNREWELGSARAVPALRGLRPAIRGLARIKVRSRAGGNRRRRAADAFRLVQISMLSDTAAALQIAMRRKLIERAGAVDLVAERETLQVRLRQMKAVIPSSTWLFRPLGAELEIKKVATRLAAVNARLKAIRFQDSNPFVTTIDAVSIGDVRKVLRDGEHLLVVQSNDDDTSLILIDSAGQVKTRSTNLGRDEIDRRVRIIRAGLSLDTGYYQDFPVRAAYQLFTDLFGPLGNDLVRSRHVISVVEGPLQSLPFAILPTRDPGIDILPAGDVRRHAVRWLALGTAVSRSPSAKTFAALRNTKRRRAGALSFLGVGDPVLSPAGDGQRSGDFTRAIGANRIADVSMLRSLISLPETADELKAIAATVGAGRSTVVTGAAATERAVKRFALHQFDILAFATHGLVAGDVFAGSEPGLVLTPPPSGSLVDDGFLSTSEIVRLRLDADLVILSACDTATSDGRPLADGLSGLARAFFAAGARNLVATHWSIPSLPAVRITTGMVRNGLGQARRSWSLSLQQAQRALIEGDGPDEFAHPASWGAFEVIGAD